MSILRWKKSVTSFLGRNGCFKCSGVEILPLTGQGTLTISALTGRGDIARCNIEVPIEDIPQLVSELQKYQK